MLYYLSFGLILGLTAGLSPGPLLTLVVSETFQHGFPAGARIALAPIITDAPIVLVTLLVATQLSNVDHVLGVISLIGGCYVLYIAYESSRQKEREDRQWQPGHRSLAKGVLANALSPHPYLFWLTIGAPTVAKSINAGIVAPVLFIGCFYLSLVGSKILLAVLVGKSRYLLSGTPYTYTMKFLALTLGIFGIALFIDGLMLLGGT